MTQNSNNNKRIAKNSIFLYVRMIFLMLVNLYTARIVLQSLGVQNYGIYNAVGGFISMFSMLSASLSTAISRFLTYTLGEKDKDKLSRVFSTSVEIQLILCVLLLIFFESIGLWFLNFKMTIPTGREFAANWVFQLSLITFVINLLSIPYNSILIANEKMNAFAYIGILEGIATLVIAFLIKYSPIDVLIYYSLLMCCVALITRCVYGLYCKKHFEESRFRWIWDIDLIKRMFSFAGWNFIGTTSGVLRTQGVNMLYNIYNGPIVNAAYGLSMQVFNAVNKFSGNFYTAVQPQITKSFAENDRNRSFFLVCTSSRLAFYLLMLIILPLFWNANFLLSIWLTNVPQYTVHFTQIILLFSLTESFSQPLIYLMLANGNIRIYQIVVGGLCLLNFPVAWMFLQCGLSPDYVQASMVLFSLFSLFARLIMLKRLVDFPIRIFLKETICKVMVTFLFASIAPCLISIFMDEGVAKFIVNTIAIEFISLFIIVSIGLTKEEKMIVKTKLSYKNGAKKK